MARPKKQGLSYFSHDVNASNDEKLEALESVYPMTGYAFFYKLLERIYRSGYKLDCKERYIYESAVKGCARGDREQFDTMMKDAAEIGLFDKTEWADNRIITSDEIKRRYSEIKKLRLKDRQRKKLSDPIPDGFPDGKQDGKSSDNEGKRGESKVKEIKKEINTIPASPDPAGAGDYNIKPPGQKAVNGAGFTMNSKKIAFSFYFAVCKKIGGNREDTNRIFFRARDKTDPVAWVLRGLSEGYVHNASQEESDNPPLVQAWIDEHIRKPVEAHEAKQCQP
jgi:hypothetical protein